MTVEITSPNNPITECSLCGGTGEISLLGDDLQQVRKDLKISRSRLAKLSNVSPLTIANVEMGKSQPRIETITRLSSALAELHVTFPFNEYIVTKHNISNDIKPADEKGIMTGEEFNEAVETVLDVPKGTITSDQAINLSPPTKDEQLPISNAPFYVAGDEEEEEEEWGID